jgi:hypothetical protein
MNEHEQKRFDQLYQRHVRALKLHGYAASTIDVYARAVRRLVAYFDCLPNKIDREPLEIYFAELLESHSWATVRVDRNGLQFFWQHVLKMDWDWVEIIKPRSISSCLPSLSAP